MGIPEYCNDPLCDRVRNGEQHPIHDTSEFAQRRNNQLKSLIDLGSRIAGSGAGAFAGLVFGGSGGAAVGAIAGSVLTGVLKDVGLDFVQRLLGPREKERIGAAWIFAIQRIGENFKNGYQLRNDDFFDASHDRSSFEEMVEGTLLAAQREFEQKKLKLYGHMIADIAFSPGISRAHTDLLIRLSQTLSYRQLCLLSIFDRRYAFNLRQINYHEARTQQAEMISVMQEIFELSNRGLITNESGSVIFGHTDLIPSKLKPEGEGETLCKLMGLSKIESNDLINILNLLQ